MISHTVLFYYFLMGVNNYLIVIAGGDSKAYQLSQGDTRSKENWVEADLEHKRLLLEEELGKKITEIEFKEANINRKEENISKREQQLEKKSEKDKEKEK